MAGLIVGAVIGTTDHGSLNGLADDDHPQYLHTDGTVRQLAFGAEVDGTVTAPGSGAVAFGHVDGGSIAASGIGSLAFGLGYSTITAGSTGWNLICCSPMRT